MTQALLRGHFPFMISLECRHSMTVFYISSCVTQNKTLLAKNIGRCSVLNTLCQTKILNLYSYTPRQDHIPVPVIWVVPLVSCPEKSFFFFPQVHSLSLVD